MKVGGCEFVALRSFSQDETSKIAEACRRPIDWDADELDGVQGWENDPR